ncbi:MAG TPA: AAA family ATPase, partial [Mycobacteriales bacterium]|nr:AAA family ATPase [Mycobacteriales bacterium]
TVAAVVELAKARHMQVALAAPTGRAAKRLEELTGHDAMTLHRLLGAQGTTGEFLRGETWPLDADVVVVDEASMLDVDLAAALVEACADGTHLLLVGDPAQLPSIGPGRVLGDVLDSGVVPAVELTTLHRLLGAQGTTGEFLRGETWPLDAQVVVVDEASMLDVDLASALVDACADGTHLLLVGDPAQREAVQDVATHGVAVLHGGPGTGKSRTVAAVVELAAARNKRIALAAPTGRAAKRLEELTGHEAMTLHRLLGAQGTTGEFLRGETWPLDADVVVVDETSMLDVELASALVDACADGTHLLLVGDPAQLPSIGPGRVLGDVLDSGVIPAVELTTLHRQAEGGTIARLAAAVREGDLPPVDDPSREVVVLPVGGGGEAAHRVVQLVTDSIPRALGIPSADVQVVTPVHRGPAGTIALNQVLKSRLNPGSGALHGFDVGDRVVATANHLDDGFANGEVGVVTGIVDGSLAVDFAGGPVVVPPKALSDLVHGWAITVHRAQGSEWPAVVAVMPPEAGGMLSRPLVYTALTRAQRHLSVVHAAGPALARGVRDVGARPRRTRLASILRGD